MMKISTNKEARTIYNRYFNSNCFSVCEAYKTGCSSLKTSAENKIKQEMINNNGWTYKIISHNGFLFSCGYLMNDKDGNIILVYHTKTNRQEILIDTDINGNAI